MHNGTEAYLHSWQVRQADLRNQHMRDILARIEVIGITKADRKVRVKDIAVNEMVD